MRLGLVVFMFLGPVTALACNVPVFRYALERWRADACQLVLFYRDALAPEQQKWIGVLENAATNEQANLTVVKADLASERPGPPRELWTAQTNAAPPWLVLRYARSLAGESPAWAGPFNATNAARILDSPARRELSRRLLRGDSAVWLFLESGVAARDEALFQWLEAESRGLEKSLSLPVPTSEDPRMRLDLPLKIAFSTVRLSRSQPDEQVLVSQLIHIHPQLAAMKEPMVFAVMGRGRALPPLVGDKIQRDLLREVAEFIIGPCSCQAKALNPGFDLLLAVDWNALFNGLPDPAPDPVPLGSLSQFAAAVRTNDDGALAVPGNARRRSADPAFGYQEISLDEGSPAVVAPTNTVDSSSQSAGNLTGKPPPTAPSETGKHSILKWYLQILLGMAVIVAVASIGITRRGAGKPPPGGKG